MKYILVPLFLLLTSLAGIAQYNPDKVSRKAQNAYNKGIEKARNGEFQEGIKWMQEAEKLHPGYADALISAAGMYSEMKNYDSAIIYYEKARSIDTEYFREYNLPYSINLAGKGEFQQALQALNEFLKLPDLNARSIKAVEFRKKSYQFALDYAGQHPLGDYKFEPVNMGDSINSKYSEYYPSLTIDGNELVFTRRVGNINEDFFSSSRLPGNRWSAAGPLTGNINTSMNEGAQNISQDGKWLIFTGCNFPDGAGSCDLYFSYLGKDGWSEPQNLGYPINTAAWESAPSLSPDKRDLYFTSNRLGGFGGSDLYVSHLQPNGHWSNPENLGPAINTAGDEGSPFIHADNHSLYFTSNGHLGYGGDDLYLSRKDSTGKWGNVINLGYPINSIENEGSLIVAADGQTAYYASDRSDSRGGLDIYSFQLRKDIRPTRTLWVKGRVYDKKTGEGLPSAVELTDIETGEIMNLLRTDKEGNYLVTLPVGRNYAFNVNRKGYLFYSDHFALSSSQPDSTYQKDIPLQPIEANASIVLKNIFFETGEYQLKPESATELDQVVRLLMDNPSLKIEISGHTDNIGQDKDNLSLSLNRARSVVNYFIEKGIAANRLTYKGYGAQKPIAGNDTEEGRSQNRRTELKIINP